MLKEEELPHVRIGIRMVRSFGFNNYRNLILRSTEKQVEATIEVVPYPDECEIAVIEQGTVYDSSPDAYTIRVSHQEARDAYQLSMRVRREVKNYLASRAS
ncbi:MAG: hypothetical protein GX774_18530 [Armatimonadetes bacterium]|jgi:hypothetical protein|nr:hypothetical protein [Armatimonadota bacterium]